MSGSENELAMLLPIIVIETQREKTNIIKDVDDMVREELEKNNLLNVVDVVNILFGVYQAGEAKNAFFR
jgi:hypothetical protein